MIPMKIDFADVPLNILYNDTITGKGKRRWYFFQLTEKKKITAYMAVPSDLSIDNDLSLYRPDTSTGTLSVAAESQNGAGQFELLSYVGEPGIYLLCVACYAGETANAFSFLVRLSDKWDDREGDDSLLAAKEQPLYQPVAHTIDNSIDEDYSILNVAEAGSYSLALLGVADELAAYELQILNTSLQPLATIKKNTVDVKKFAVGSYILRLLSTNGSFDPETPCPVVVFSIPASIDTTAPQHYRAVVSKDKKHVIEIMSNGDLTSDAPVVTGVSIDGVAVDVKGFEFKATRTNTS